MVQGGERSMLLEEVNGYKRALQHQALAKAQFGAPQPPGFSIQARAGADELLPLLHCYSYARQCCCVVVHKS